MPARNPRAPVTLTARSGAVLRQSVSLGIVLEHARTKSDPVRAFVGLRNGVGETFTFTITFENGDRATGLTYDWRSIIDWLAKSVRRKNGAFKRVVLDPSTPAEMVERYLEKKGPLDGR